jgi:type III restriction enzyme
MAGIVDPHGLQFANTLPRLQGLAVYVEEYGEHYRRIDSIAGIDGTFRVLDLTEPGDRQAVRKASEAKSLYLSAAAFDYIA